MSLARVALEDLGRPVLRAVVGRDDEVDAGVEVERDLRVDDVGLVADEERHDELHRRRSLDTGPGDPLRRRRQAASGPRRRLRRIPRSGSCERYARIARHFASRSRAPSATGANGVAGLPERVRLLRVEAEEHRAGTLLVSSPLSHAWSGCVSGEPGHEHDVGALHGVAHCSPDVVVVAVTVEVDAPEREPARRDAEARARHAILLAASASRLALGREARAAIPAARRRRRVGIEREHRQQLDASCRSRAHRAIDAPSESTPSSECGETTTIGASGDHDGL